MRDALGVGLVGCSIEDATGRSDDPIYRPRLTAERVAAAAEAAHGGPHQLLLTARAENHLHGRDDLTDTIARLQSFQQAGADVLYPPGLIRGDDIKAVVNSVDRPINCSQCRAPRASQEPLALSTAPHISGLAHLAEAPFPTSDQVLLCSVGDNLAGERTAQQLRESLRDAGFPARVTRHLIRLSPLLRRCSKGRYQLRPLECCRAKGSPRHGDTCSGNEGRGVAGHDAAETGPG